MQHAPVLIAGAGPAGLAAALSLAQSGVTVRIIDLLDKPTSQSRAAIVHARTLELFERLGIEEDFLAASVKIHGAAVYGPGKKLLIRPSLDLLPTHYPFMLGLEQSETERLLTARLNALGVFVERPVQLLNFTQTQTSVQARLKYGDGREATEEFSHLIGTDGAHSAARATLGLHLEGETLDVTWITADVKIQWDREPDEAVVYLSAEGFAFIAPMNDGRWRVLVNVSKLSPAEAEKVSLDDIQKLMRERFDVDALLYDPIWISPFAVNTRMTSKMREGRVFLAGDASHIHSPVGGQGMNTGIQDSLNLAWKLALVIKGQATEALLDSYNFERHQNAKRLLQLVGPMTKVINLRHTVPTEIRSMAMRVVGALGLTFIMARNFSMLEVAYPESPLNEDRFSGWLRQGPTPGQRAPDVEGLLENGDDPCRLFDLCKKDTRHQLLLFSGPKPAPAQLAELEEIAAEFGSLGELVRVVLITDGSAAPGAVFDPEGAAHLAYGVEGPALYLVRPDGYVAFRASSAERKALRDYLAKWYPWTRKS